LGARHGTAREKHGGLVVAMATESLIKVVALVTLTLLGLFGVFGGPGGLSDWLQANPQALTNLYHPLQDGTWHSMILAFFVSAVVIQRMFDLAFSVNVDP